MIGRTISHYRILEKLGEGGMGIVYKAEDIKLKRTVALKFLPPALTRDHELRERFMHEARAASALEHPNICNIHEIDETEDGQMFICMAYYDGEGLKDKIARGPLPLDEAIEIALQIMQGLAQAHGKAIIHRDIKPANILVTKEGQAKIVDFGLAKLSGQTKLTQTGTTMGTMAYMSPEQTRGAEVDPRSDIFSLGVILYEMITGNSPFKGEYEQAVVYAILNEEPEPVTSLRTGVPMELEHIISKALAKDPQERYQHADELIVDLRRLQRELKAGAVPAKEAARRKRFNKVVLPGFLLFVVVAALVGYLFIGREAESKERIPIAVVDFVNETNEAELNGLSGILITSLEQSRRLSVLTRSRMFDTLKQLGKDEVHRIDDLLGREICKQANIHAMVIASIRKFGRVYTIDLKVLDPEKDEYLLTAREEGEGQESVLAMIDKLSKKTRKGLKEQAEEIQITSKKVEEVTTANLEAYQHYFLGEQLVNQLRFRKSQEEFKKAIEIDPTFALAYYRLAYAKDWWGEEGVDLPLRKAMQYLDQAPEKERYLIQALHARRAGKVDEAIALYQALLEMYPAEKEALWELGDRSYHRGDYNMAVTYFEKVLAIDPTFERAMQHIIWSYKDRGQYDQMLEYAKRFVAQKATLEAYTLLGEAYLLRKDTRQAQELWRRAQDVFPNSATPTIRLAWTYFFQQEYDKAEREFKSLLQEAAGPSDRQMAGLRNLGLFYAYFGRYRDVLRNLDRIVEIARENGYLSMVPLAYAEQAFWVMLGWRDEVKTREMLAKGLEHKADANFYFYLYLFRAYLMMGEHEKAKSVAEEHLTTFMPYQDLVVKAYVHRAKGEYSMAVRDFLTVTQNTFIYDQIYYAYDLAACYFETGQFLQAVDVLHRLQDIFNDSHYFRSAVYSRSFYLLGKIYEKNGDRNLAVENYEKFLDLWKEADQDLPDLIDAKARLARLQRLTTK
ncbi:MAG: protein kinase [bacterium]